MKILSKSMLLVSLCALLILNACSEDSESESTSTTTGGGQLQIKGDYNKHYSSSLKTGETLEIKATAKRDGQAYDGNVKFGIVLVSGSEIVSPETLFTPSCDAKTDEWVKFICPSTVGSVIIFTATIDGVTEKLFSNLAKGEIKINVP